METIHVSYLEFLLHKRFSIVSHLSISPIIYLYQNGLVDVYFILWVIIQCSFIYFSLKLFQLWPLGALLFGSCAFDIPISLGFHCKMLQDHLVYFLQQLRSSHFFKEALLLLLENGVRNRDMGTESAQCHWSVIASGPSHPTEGGKISMYTKLCIYAYV